jgi:hypothetical protein
MEVMTNAVFKGLGMSSASRQKTVELIALGWEGGIDPVL